jgi:hypothetical protein
MAWPVKQTTSLAYAQVAPVIERAHGEWWRSKDTNKKGQQTPERREQEFVASYYANEAKAREERENQENRERFAAMRQRN